jgi:hypothetical protein
MRRLVPVLLVAGIGALGQHVPVINSRVGTAIPPSNAYRFGNILFPGGIAPHQQTHAGRIGGAIQGTFRGQPYPGRGAGVFGRPRTVVVPYAVPVYLGDPYAYAYAQQTPNVTVVMPQQPTPSVVINHNYTADTAKPVLRDYSATELPEPGAGLRVYEGPNRREAEKKPEANPDAKPEPARREPASDKPTIYLIALTDSTVRQAIGYWIQDGTLNYVTPQGTINRVTLDQVDRDMSRQLNVERGLDFELSSVPARP